MLSRVLAFVEVKTQKRSLYLQPLREEQPNLGFFGFFGLAQPQLQQGTRTCSTQALETLPPLFLLLLFKINLCCFIVPMTPQECWDSQLGLLSVGCN